MYLTYGTPVGYINNVILKTDDVKNMMYRRILYCIMFGAMLAMAATFMPPSDAQAMGTACRCPGGCCCKQDVAEGLALMAQSLGTVASEDCSCSTGANPFGTGETRKSAYVDSSKERLSQSATVFTAVVFHAPARLLTNRHKPSVVSFQCLYLLNSSFRI